MPFITTIAEDQAEGAVAGMYETDREVFGYLPNLTKGFSLRPDVYAAWRALNGAVKANMDLRRYELATVSAAHRLRSSYCTLAHGQVLLDNFVSPAGLRAAIGEGTSGELDALDAAVIELADKVALDAASVTQADVDRLRSFGLSDEDVVDVVLAAAVRCFFSKVLDGLGVQADARYAELDPELRDVLTVGRPISADAGEPSRSTDPVR